MNSVIGAPRAPEGRQIVVHGCYNNRNFGDLIMLDLITREIERCTQSVPCCPWVHPLEACNISARAGSGLRDAWHCDVAIMGGGGYFTDDESRGSTKRLLRYFVPAMLWSLKRVPYCIVGVGAGPSLSRVGQAMVRRICAGAQSIVVRDEESRGLLAEAGVPRERVEVTADIVIALSRADIPDAGLESAVRVLGPRSSKRRLCLHLSLPEGSNALIDRIIAPLQTVFGDRHDVEIFFVFDHLETNRGHLEQAASTGFRTARVIDKQPHWVTAGILSQMDAVLTTKLHVGIAAWALGVPPFSVASHGKTVRFYRQVGRGAFARRTEDDPSVIAEWGRLFLQNDESAMTVTGAVRSDLVARSKANMDKLRSFFADACARRR